MNKNKVILLIPIILFFLANYCTVYAKTYYGIIIASKLNARNSPSLSGKIIKSFEFGTPVELVNVSKNKDSIEGKNDFWYQEKNSSGWLFGSFLLKIEKQNIDVLRILEKEFYVCNVEIDGYFASNVPYFIINNYYITHTPISLYPPLNDTEPFEAIVIGKFHINKDESIISLEPLYYGNYDSNSKFLNTKNLKIEKNKYLLHKMKDEYGVYYIDKSISLNDGKKTITHKSRVEARKICRNNNFKVVDENNPVFEIFYVLNNISINEIQKRFPLIKGKNDPYK